MVTFYIYYVFIEPTGIAVDYTNGIFWAGIYAILGFMFAGLCPPLWQMLYRKQKQA